MRKQNLSSTVADLRGRVQHMDGRLADLAALTADAAVPREERGLLAREADELQSLRSTAAILLVEAERQAAVEAEERERTADAAYNDAPSVVQEVRRVSAEADRRLHEAADLLRERAELLARLTPVVSGEPVRDWTRPAVIQAALHAAGLAECLRLPRSESCDLETQTDHVAGTVGDALAARKNRRQAALREVA